MFNIASQHAGVINNVAGEQTILAGQHVASASADARELLQQIHLGIDAVGLPPQVSRRAHEQAANVDDELRHPTPDHGVIARKLSDLTRFLVTAGALTNAGTALATGISQLATWLGPIGLPILRLLSPA